MGDFSRSSYPSCYLLLGFTLPVVYGSGHFIIAHFYFTMDLYTFCSQIQYIWDLFVVTLVFFYLLLIWVRFFFFVGSRNVIGQGIQQWRFDDVNRNLDSGEIQILSKCMSSCFFFKKFYLIIILFTYVKVDCPSSSFRLSFFNIIFRFKHTVQMLWLMRKIVFSSFRIVQGAKLWNLPFFSSWKEQVMEHKL